jgi:hypothetical protein
MSDELKLFGGFVLIFFLVVVSFATVVARNNGGKYRLSSGEIVECRLVIETSCGLTMNECKDGKKYVCQTNVVRGK